MSVRYLLATPIAVHVVATSSGSTTNTLTTARFWATLAALVGVVGVVIGGIALSRAARGVGNRGRTGAIVAAVSGVVAAVGGGVNLTVADGGPGTGNGVVAGGLALASGLIAMALGGLALARSRSVDADRGRSLTGSETLAGAEVVRVSARSMLAIGLAAATLVVFIVVIAMGGALRAGLAPWPGIGVAVLAIAAFAASRLRKSFVVAGLLAASGVVGVGYALIQTDFLRASSFPGPIFGIILGLPLLGLAGAEAVGAARARRSDLAVPG